MRGFYTGSQTVPIRIKRVLQKHGGLTAGWCLIVLDIPATNITRFDAKLCGKDSLEI